MKSPNQVAFLWGEEMLIEIFGKMVEFEKKLS